MNNKWFEIVSTKPSDVFKNDSSGVTAITPHKHGVSNTQSGILNIQIYKQNTNTPMYTSNTGLCFAYVAARTIRDSGKQIEYNLTITSFGEGVGKDLLNTNTFDGNIIQIGFITTTNNIDKATTFGVSEFFKIFDNLPSDVQQFLSTVGIVKNGLICAQSERVDKTDIKRLGVLEQIKLDNI